MANVQGGNLHHPEEHNKKIFFLLFKHEKNNQTLSND
jgi:hypothetical protein